MLFRAFAAHEIRSQLRSPRFRLLAIAYVILGSIPPFIPLGVRTAHLLGPGTYAFAGFFFLPLLTAIVAALLSVDALTRERDEGSLTVLALAPISNAGYVLRRWLALQLVLLPLTAVPPLVAYGFCVARLGDVAILTFAGPWLTKVVPIALIFSAFALGLGTIAGGMVIALLTGFALYAFVLTFGNDLLAAAHLRLHSPNDLLGLDRGHLESILYLVKGYVRFRPPSDAPFDFREQLEALGTRAALHAGVAALMLAGAVAFLRRARPDLRPLAARDDHPLRTGIRLLNRLREEYAPDPGLMLRDYAVLALGLAAAISSVGWIAHRSSYYRAQAMERYRTETRNPIAPMSAAIVPVTWDVDAHVASGGAIDSTVLARLQNRGAAPQSHLAFMLNPSLRVDVSPPARTRRAWDRLAVDLAAPLAPGETREIRFAVHGIPRDDRFPFPEYPSFVDSMTRALRAKVASEQPDFGQSTTTRVIHRGTVDVTASDLTPVPRYTTWTLTARGFWMGAHEPPAERVGHPAPLRVRVRLDRDWLMADSCGTVARNTLDSGCTLALADYRIVGGDRTLLDLTPTVALLVLPGHTHPAQTQAPSLLRVVELARTAWPGLTLPPRLALAETITPPQASLVTWFDPSEASGSGALVSVPESKIVGIQLIDPGDSAAVLVAQGLARRRELAPEEQVFFHQLFVELAAQRLGRVDSRGAVRSKIPWDMPILEKAGDFRQRSERIAPIFADLQYRLGSDRVMAGINDFLAASGGAGSAKEMLDAIGRRAGVSLDGVYRDYFIGHALPTLALEGVVLRRQGDEWIAEGRVVNRNEGEAFCPVVLRTSFQPSQTVVHVEGHGSFPFLLRTRYEPRSVQLDPQHVCYRFVPVGTIESVDFRSQR